MTEIRDLPLTQRLCLAGPGSLIGEEDVFARKKYSCSFQCLSQHGKIYRIARQNFMQLRQNEEAWLAILELIVSKEKRLGADYIKHRPVDLERDGVDEKT